MIKCGGGCPPEVGSAAAVGALSAAAVSVRQRRSRKVSAAAVSEGERRRGLGSAAVARGCDRVRRVGVLMALALAWS